MKIVFVNQPSDRVQPPNLNSIGLWSYKLSSILAKDHNLTIYSGQKDLFEYRNDCLFISTPYIKNRTYKSISDVLKPFYPKDFPPFAADFFMADYITKVAKDIQKKGADVIHVHTYSQFVPILRKYNPHVKIILHMHCDWLNQLDYDHLLPRIEACDRIASCSNYLTNRTKQRFPQYAEKFVTVYNGVDTRQFLPVTKNLGYLTPNLKLLFISRISPEKGVHDLIEAFNIVVTQHPDAQLYLIGQKIAIRKDFIVELSDSPLIRDLARFYNGEYYYQLLQEKINKNAANHVHFLGHIDHTEIPFHFRGTSLLVNPSIVEQFGISLVEAMASGLPTVATDIGGIPEIVEHGKTGYLVPPASPEKLAAGINLLLSDSLLRSRMGDAGRKRVVGKFTWNAAARTIENMYQSF